MRRHYLGVPSFLLAISLHLASEANAATQYRVTEISLPNVAKTTSAINSVGQVVVNSIVGGVYLWTPDSPNAPTGTLAQIQNNDALLSWTGTAINDSGQIAGMGQHLYVWTPNHPNGSYGTATILSSLPGASDSPAPRALGINNSGQVTGVAFVGLTAHAGLWSPTTPNGPTFLVHDLGATTDFPKDSTGYAINNSGQIAAYSYVTAPTGYFARRAAVWTPDMSNGPTGAFRLLTPPAPDLPDTDYSQAYALNDAGDAVGASNLIVDGIIRTHAFLWPANSASFVDLGGPPESAANAINAFGQIVGYANYPVGQRAFLWNPANGMLDLNTLLDPADTGWTLYTATGINAAGQIVGVGRDPAGRIQPFLLTPTPEPSSLAPLFITAALPICRRGRRSPPSPQTDSFTFDISISDPDAPHPNPAQPTAWLAPVWIGR